MSTRLPIASVVDEPLSVAEHEGAVVEKAHGAGGSFAAVVSDPSPGQPVTELRYVGPPTAGEVIRELAEEFAAPESVDEVGMRLPIWKQQVLADGEEEWTVCP